MTGKRNINVGAPHAVAAGAGLAAALLFSLAQQGTVVAMVLAYLSPLPIMIATLGFGRLSGLAAAALGTLVTGALVILHQPRALWSASLIGAGIAAFGFAASLGLPAFWLALLATLGKMKPTDSREIGRDTLQSLPRDYYLLERILTHAVLIATALVAAAVIWISIHNGGFNAAVDKAATAIDPLIDKLIGRDIELPGGIEIHDLARLVVLAAAPAVAGSSLVMFMLNLWLAGRVVQVSGRLTRPWPDIPRFLRLPRVFAPIFAVAFIAAFAGGLPGLLAAILATALGVAFALQGLATVHALSRGASFRTPLLFAVYLGLTLLMPWPLVLFTLIGLAEAIFSLRDRKAGEAFPRH
jgi:hypothetical protein